MHNKDNKSYCSLLWNGITINANGVIRPCCRFDVYDTSIKELSATNLLESYNTPFFESVRKSALEDKAISACHKCYKEEKYGITSLRQHHNKLNSNTSSELFTTAESIEYIELFLGRECNLACHTCKPLLSSTWEKEVKKLGWNQELVNLNWKSQGFDFKTTSFSLAGYKNLKEVKFVGGETLINDRHIEMLNSIPSHTRKNVIVDYYTNGTIPFKDSYYETWKQFKQVKVRFSIDGHKELNEYIRYPSKWSVIENNIKDCLSTFRENVHFRLHTTVSILNIFSLNKISEWWDEISKNSPCSTEEVKLNLLHDPSFLSIAILKLVKNDYTKFMQSEKWLSFIDHSSIEDKHLKQLKYFLIKLDHQRGNNLKETLPQLSDILF